MRVRFRHYPIDSEERNAKCAQPRKPFPEVRHDLAESRAGGACRRDGNHCPRRRLSQKGRARHLPRDGCRPTGVSPVGLKSFPQTLPLADKEVVLTFDDGPFPATTTKVLAALAAECVQATFFLIGRNAEANPATVKKIAAGGHSIGHHTWSHKPLDKIGQQQALEEIDHGIAADEMALHGKAVRQPSTPFFPLSRLRLDAGFAGQPAIARDRGIRRRPLGQRLESDDSRTAIAAFDFAPRRGRQRHHPATRPESADGQHASGVPAIPQAQRLQDRSSRCATTGQKLVPMTDKFNFTVKPSFTTQALSTAIRPGPTDETCAKPKQKAFPHD